MLRARLMNKTFWNENILKNFIGRMLIKYLQNKTKSI